MAPVVDIDRAALGWAPASGRAGMTHRNTRASTVREWPASRAEWARIVEGVRTMRTLRELESDIEIESDPIDNGSLSNDLDNDLSE